MRDKATFCEHFYGILASVQSYNVDKFNNKLESTGYLTSTNIAILLPSVAVFFFSKYVKFAVWLIRLIIVTEYKIQVKLFQNTRLKLRRQERTDNVYLGRNVGYLNINIDILPFVDTYIMTTCSFIYFKINNAKSKGTSTVKATAPTPILGAPLYTIL